MEAAVQVEQALEQAIEAVNTKRRIILREVGVSEANKNADVLALTRERDLYQKMINKLTQHQYIEKYRRKTDTARDQRDQSAENTSVSG